MYKNVISQALSSSQARFYSICSTPKGKPWYKGYDFYGHPNILQKICDYKDCAKKLCGLGNTSCSPNILEQKKIGNHRHHEPARKDVNVIYDSASQTSLVILPESEAQSYPPNSFKEDLQNSLLSQQNSIEISEIIDKP